MYQKTVETGIEIITKVGDMKMNEKHILKCEKPEDTESYTYDHRTFHCYPYCLARNAKNLDELKDIALLWFKRSRATDMVNYFNQDLFDEEIWEILDDILYAIYAANVLRENGVFEEVYEMMGGECYSPGRFLKQCLDLYDENIMKDLDKFTWRKHKWNIRASLAFNFTPEYKDKVLEKFYNELKENYYQKNKSNVSPD